MIVYPKSVDFFNPLKRLKLGSFTTILKKPAKMKSYKVVQFSFQSNIFGKIAIIQQSSNVDLKEVFCYPLEPVPWSIAYGAGDMIKTNKSASITEQGSGVWDLEVVNDGMAMVHKVRNKGVTFDEFVNKLLKYGLTSSCHARGINIVFDVYRETSTKNALRGHHEVVRLHYISRRL